METARGKVGAAIESPTFSIVVPTRNRAPHLRPCLDGLAALTYDRSRFEALFVDNASIDSTQAVLADEMRADRFPLRTVVEENPGPSHARNRGIHETSGTYLVFIDDDAVVTPGMLTAYERVLGDDGPRTAQGRVIPFFERGRPSWLHEDLMGFFGKVDQPREERLFRRSINTCNFAISRDATKAVGLFRPDLGPGGAGMGEDTEYGLRARDRGFEIAYAHDALVYHLIPAQRATRRETVRRCYVSGRSQPVFQSYRASTIRTLASFFKTSVTRIGACLLTGDEARRMKLLGDTAQHFGRVVQLLRQRLLD